MIRSRRLAAAALGGAVVLSCAVPAGPAQAAPAADEPAATVQLNLSAPSEIRYAWAGASGFRYWLPGSGSTATHWADFPGAVPPPHAGPDDPATGTDVVTTRPTATTVRQEHRSTGATATVTVPEGQTYRAASGWSVLTEETGTPGALHVLRAAADGTTTDLPVTGLPAGAEPTGAYVTGGSVRRLAVVHTLGGATSVGLVDLADGVFRPYVTGLAATPRIVFNDRWLVAGGSAVRVDSAPGTEPVAAPSHGGHVPQAVVGDQLLFSADPGEPVFNGPPDLVAVSLATGARSTVLKSSYGAFAPTPDGGALATAGPSSADWHVHRITPAEDGGTAAAEVFTVPAGRGAIRGLMMAGGELLMYGNVTDVGGNDAVHAVPLDPAGRPAGPQTVRARPVNVSPCLAGDAACPQFEALGDGGFAYLSTDAAGEESLHAGGRRPNAYAYAATGDAGGRIGTGTGRYVLYNGGTPGVQKVGDLPDGTGGTIVLNRTRTAAAVWGQRLWTPGTAPGSVVAHDLKAKRNVATVDTGAPCVPSELQAVNAWLYWTCGADGPAGVYDRATGRAVEVPAGRARLADGYLVRENRATHELLLTDFHTGAAVTRTAAVLPAHDQDTGGDTGRWTVDRFGGNLAYRGDGGRVAIVTAGVPTSPLAQMEARTDAVPGPTAAQPWQPVWQLNKPSTWTLRLTGTDGTVVRTLTGASTAAAVRPSWDGTTTAGGRAPRDTYTWRLTAEPRDGQGPGLLLTGTTTVS
ncbi:hypothetical protein [Streptomyces minutiscleroticus]|uniref:hypothetical protein n=1 Tax=Streptomyces minutiscleroticus TaxID=68238 RepID=UPI0033167430